MMICLEFPSYTREADVGRIPSCIEWINVGVDGRMQLLSMFATDISFNPEFVSRLGWIGIDADTGGQLEDEDELLLALMLEERQIQQFFGSSHRDISQSVGGNFLGVRILDPTANDFGDLRRGWWTRSDWIDILGPLDLLWLGWEELFCFTWPLQFALVQLREGDGHTTMVGPPDFISEFRQRSNPDHWYQWKPWGLPLSPDSQPKAT